MMTLQAVFFDMGGTIETFWYTPELRLKAVPGLRSRLLDANIDLHLDDAQLLDLVTRGLDRYHQWRMQSLDELPTSRMWSEYILADYSIDPKVLDTTAEALTLYIETNFYHREMRPEVPAVLETIREMGYKIGLISNVSSRGQVPENLEKYGIRQYFNPIVMSSVYGRRKPDPAIFHYAARLANVPVSQCAYVGDRIQRDILGAKRAGFQLSIQIVHDFKHGEIDSGATPDVVIHDMTELVDILRAENFKPSHPALPMDQKVRALLFDAGDILYYRPQENRKLTCFLNELGLEVKDGQDLEKETLVNMAYQGVINQEQYREAVLRLYGVTQPEDIARGKQLLLEEDNGVQFFEGVQETLVKLKDCGYLLGIVTDTANPIYIKLSWFERGGFGDVWDSIISSKELGVRKPDPRIYQAALQQLGLNAEQVIFVGHKASELDGAKAMCLTTVAFNNDPEARADFYITHFSDLLDLPLLSLSASTHEVGQNT
jgi:putative hydrolase of the HAD superfamily